MWPGEEAPEKSGSRAHCQGLEVHQEPVPSLHPVSPERIKKQTHNFPKAPDRDAVTGSVGSRRHQCEMASGTTGVNSLPGNASSCRPHLLAQVASVVLSLFCTALLVFSALGNILTLRLACQKGRKMNSTGVYLVHLAVSDLLFTVALPGRVVYYMLGSSWPFGEGLCRLMVFMLYTNTYGGLYLTACASVDCYLAVIFAHRAHGSVWLAVPG
ncbi:G-protein coupled receptor 183-like isoform X1 [Aotus nancymaae]|uniref:G-protein coupled receptor 183-like isoform X1 n=1 Tax=Aotus nancymaae TaxID=37293 RepID=UPI0030FE990E